MAPPIQQQTGRLGQLTVAKFVFIFLLVLTAFQVINTHEQRNVHEEQIQDSHGATPSSKYNPDENIPFQEVKKEDVSDGSYDFQKSDEHSYQQNKVIEKHIREEHNNAEERSDNSGNIRYSHVTGKDMPRHNGQLVKPFGKRAGQSPNDAGDLLEFLGPCWLKAITLTAVISTSPVIVLLLIPVENAATHKNLQKILLSFATGSLLGDAFFHMIPSAIMTSDHGDKEVLEHGHSHTDGHSHGHGFHSHDTTVGLSILSGIIVFLMADKFGQFLKYGRYDENECVNVSSGGSLGSIDNSSSGKKNSTKRQDHAYSEKKNSAKRIENSAPETKNSTKRIENSAPETKNSTTRIDSSSPEKKNSTKRIENCSLEKKNKAKRVENSSEKKSKARNQGNEASPEKQSSTKNVEDSSLRKRKGKGKHANHKGKDRAGERCADTNKEIETDMTTNKTHSETELYSKSERRSEEKRALSTNIQTAPAAYNPDIRVTGYLALVADFAYNFTDGLAIGASFMAGGSIGTVTSVTIFVHELSHEIGDFAILIQSGYSKGKAVLLQFLTAFGSLLGTVCSLTLQETTRSAAVWILPFTAGGFIYIALVSVIPDLLQKSRTWQSIKEILAMIIGVLLMLLVALYE